MATGATFQKIIFPFDPKSIGGCKAWFDAFDASYTTSGNTVTAWTNKSGNANATTGGGTVSINQATLNGKSSVRFPAGTGNYLNVGSISYSTSYRNLFFLVTVGASGVYYYYLNANDSVCGQSYTWGGGVDIEINKHGLNGLVTNPSGYFSSTSIVSICTSSGGNTGIWVNGSNQTLTINNVGTGGFWSTGTSAIITLGGESGPTTGTLDIFELMQYDGILTTVQRQSIEGYLAWKWGLQANLPANHPYKNAAPTSTPTLNTSQITTIPLTIVRNKVTNPMQGFTPASTGGLTQWLDGADPLGTGTPPALGTLATWYDKSGNGRNASAESAASYSTDGIVFINGTFTSGNSYTMNVPYSANYSIFLVATNTTIAQCYFFGRSGTPGSSPTFIQGYIGSGIGLEWYEANDRATIATTPSSPFIASIDHIQGTSIVGWYYGTQSFSNAQTQAYSGTAWTTLGKSVIGQNYYAGTMKELIFVGSNVTTPQRQQLEGYLAWKWGLQANLPPGHPYGGNSPFPSTLPLKTISIRSIFKPTNYAGCQLWLDAFDPIGNGSRQKSPLTLTSWVDKSTNARHANMFNGSSIAYSPTAFNNRPALLFTQTQNMSSAAAAGTFPTSFTFFMIYQRTAGGTYDTLVTRTVGNIAAPLDFYTNTSTGNFSRNIGNGTAQADYNTTSGSNFTNVTTPTLYYANATAASGLLDAFNFATPTDPSSGTLTGVYYGDTGTAIYIGTRADSVTKLTASVAEVIVYSTTPTDIQRQTIEGYLVWKWGLVASLPASHPYKNYPPPPQ